MTRTTELLRHIRFLQKIATAFKIKFIIIFNKNIPTCLIGMCTIKQKVLFII